MTNTSEAYTRFVSGQSTANYIALQDLKGYEFFTETMYFFGYPARWHKGEIRAISEVFANYLGADKVSSDTSGAPDQGWFTSLVTAWRRDKAHEHWEKRPAGIREPWESAGAAIDPPIDPPSYIRE